MDHPSNSATTVVNQIRALMGRYRTTQADLAHVLGITEASVSRRLKACRFTVDELEAIAAHFDVPITRLFEDPFAPADQQRRPYPWFDSSPETVAA